MGEIGHGEPVREQLISPEVTASDIRRELPGVGGTEIVLQRHEKYQRKEGVDIATGSLFPEAAERSYRQTREIVAGALASLSDEERKDVSFLVVASNTKFRQQGMRSMETAEQVLQALRDELQEEGLDEAQILNNRSAKKGIAPITKMQAPRFMDDSADYLAFLQETYGDETQGFWKAFEEDTHKAKREQMGAEGPDEMDQRFTAYVRALANYAKAFHKDNPGKRLILWTVSHYDTVSPFIKRHVTKTDPHQYVPVDYGAGISVEIDQDGRVISQFHGKEYNVDLNT